MADLTTLADVKAYLGIPSATVNSDALLTRFIAAGSVWVTSFLNRAPLDPADFVDVYDGNGQDFMLLRHAPVISVAKVEVCGTVIPAANTTTWPPSSGYTFDSPGDALATLTLWGTFFPRQRKGVRVSYRAGYATVPADLSQAVTELVGEKYRRRDRIGQVSAAVAQQTIVYSQKDMADHIRTALLNYQRKVPV